MPPFNQTEHPPVERCPHQARSGIQERQRSGSSSDRLPPIADGLAMFGQHAMTVPVWRPPAPSGGKIGTPTDPGTTVQILVEPHGTYDPIVTEPNGHMFYTLQADATHVPLPDIRAQDRLIDPTTRGTQDLLSSGLGGSHLLLQGYNALSSASTAPYIVRGVWPYPRSHLELFIQRQVGA